MTHGKVGSKTNPWVYVPTPFAWHYYGKTQTGNIVDGWSWSKYDDADAFIEHELKPQGIVEVVYIEMVDVNPAYLNAKSDGRLWGGI